MKTLSSISARRLCLRSLKQTRLRITVSSRIILKLHVSILLQDPQTTEHTSQLYAFGNVTQSWSELLLQTVTYTISIELKLF